MIRQQIIIIPCQQTLQKQMGTACFQKADTKSNPKKPLKESQQNASILDLKIWKQYLGMSSKKQNINFTYSFNVVHQTFKQIEKDITRTYPESSFFVNKKSNLELFDQVLRKIAVYFPRTGYTQGMNFLVGFFLLSGLDFDETFTICVKIFTNIDLMCLGLYQDQFPLNRLYCTLVWEVVGIRNPKIKQKLTSFGIFDDLWIFQWFMTFFIYSLPFEVIPELLTFIFMKKQFAFVRIASSLVMLMWPFIEKCEQSMDFLNLTGELKKLSSFNKMFKVEKILENADKISNEEIINLLVNTQLKDSNKYCAFFSLPENDRKLKYLQILGELKEQREQFLKDPKGYKFNRNQTDISVIDSIELNQAKIMFHSYSFHKKTPFFTYEHINDKLWKSDMHKIGDQSAQSITMKRQQEQKNENQQERRMIKKTNSEHELGKTGR